MNKRLGVRYSIWILLILGGLVAFSKQISHRTVNQEEKKTEWNQMTEGEEVESALEEEVLLPSQYSYVDTGRIEKAKDQGKYGTCWAFATLTALETSLMPEERFDFSEDHLIYHNALAEDIQDGGDYIMSMAYLMAWKGPVLESEDPYGDGRTIQNLKPSKHVQEAQIIPEKDYDQIKKMVYQYGGVESSLYLSMTDADSKSIYYNESNSAYCYRGDRRPNHDVVIIGWDDEYPKEKFNDSTIQNNGAFLCRNSWGSTFGEEGNFYVSYEDTWIGSNNVCYTKVEPPDNYDRIYQSDLCGWTGSMGFQDRATVYFANIYQAKQAEKLQAVGFYATAENISYQVFVCENYQDLSSLNERNHVSASGRIQQKGFYTIPLDRIYEIAGNDSFAVIVKVTKKQNEETEKLIPVEMTTDEMSLEVDLSDGEGYFSAEGDHWQSAEKQKCNICLKAYTSD